MPRDPFLAVKSVDPFSGQRLKAQSKLKKKSIGRQEKLVALEVIKNRKKKACDLAMCVLY